MLGRMPTFALDPLGQPAASGEARDRVIHSRGAALSGAFLFAGKDGTSGKDRSSGNRGRCSMPIIGVAGQKGGAGKTTVAVNLACALQARGKRTVLFDCDPQESAIGWNRGGTLPIEILPAHLSSHDDPARQRRETNEWRRTIAETNHEFTVLDAPPHIDAALFAVFYAADLVLLPCTPSKLDVSSLAGALDFVRDIQAERGGAPIVAAVPNRVDHRTGAATALLEALKGMKVRIAPGFTSRIAFANSVAAGQWIGQFDQGGVGHAEAVALANFVIKQFRRR